MKAVLSMKKDKTDNVLADFFPRVKYFTKIFTFFRNALKLGPSKIDEVGEGQPLKIFKWLLSRPVPLKFFKGPQNLLEPFLNTLSKISIIYLLVVVKDNVFQTQS